MINDQVYKVIEILADGQFHSGAELGNKLQITRSAIWKIIKTLHQKQINIECIHGKGYRVPNGLQLFSKEKILQYFTENELSAMSHLAIFYSIDSTNNYIQKQIQQGAKTGLVCLAEEQTAGRGRCQRKWVSPFLRNIYLSLLWSFHRGPAALTGLTLVVGVAIVNALSICGIKGLTIKWPNDVYWGNKKLAGVLTEMSIDDIGLCHAIIGIGININMSEFATDEIKLPYIDCQTILNSCPDKNKITGTVLNVLFSFLSIFEKKGWLYFKDLWSQYDCLLDREVVIFSGQLEFYGVAKGVDNNGGLILDSRGELKTFNAGEVSVRTMTK